MKEEGIIDFHKNFFKIFYKSNIVGYFLAAMLAGFYVGIGILLIFSIGGQLGNSPFTKVIIGISFDIALRLVIIAGGELFTGNNLVITCGILNKKSLSLSEME